VQNIFATIASGQQKTCTLFSEQGSWIAERT